MSKIAILSHEVVGAELAILGEWADARGHEITRYFREQKWDAQDVLAPPIEPVMEGRRNLSCLL